MGARGYKDIRSHMSRLSRSLKLIQVTLIYVCGGVICILCMHRCIYSIRVHICVLVGIYKCLSVYVRYVCMVCVYDYVYIACMSTRVCMCKIKALASYFEIPHSYFCNRSFF